MAVGGIRAEQMDPADVAWLHMDRPANLMVVNTAHPAHPGPASPQLPTLSAQNKMICAQSATREVYPMTAK